MNTDEFMRVRDEHGELRWVFTGRWVSKHLDKLHQRILANHVVLVALVLAELFRWFPELLRWLR